MKKSLTSKGQGTDGQKTEGKRKTLEDEVTDVKENFINSLKEFLDEATKVVDIASV